MNSKINLYDSNNEFIETASTFSSLVKLEELPSYVKEAFITTEDKSFYSHNGLNYKRIIKAMYTNLKSGYAKEGASTISQQLIKNTHLTNQKTLDRKVKEILLTRKLEREFSKDDILETYLNIIYFGSSSYGIESASKTYFNKSAKNLSLAESATLAGIIKAPRTYSPFYDVVASRKRRDLILKIMYNDNKINKIEYENAINENLEVNESNNINSKRIYEKAAIEEVSKILDLSEKDVAISGLRVYTYMDKALQNEVRSLTLDDGYYHKNSAGNTADSGVIVIDNKTGGVNACFGKSSYDLIHMKRSPGSAIKPILVYAPALEYGKIAPSTMILDEEIDIKGYTPHNVGDKFHGWVSTRNTIEKSLNIPAVKIMGYTGIKRSKDFAKRAGIKFDDSDNGYAIALGGFTSGIGLLELTNSYLPFSNNGQFIEAKFVRKIEDANGKVLYENRREPTKVMSAETAYLMNDMLISGACYGTSKKLNTLDFEVAGKTGTVGLKDNNNSDAWSVAYTPSKTVGVWLGNSTGKKDYALEPSNNGGTYATMLVRDIINKANSGKTEHFNIPNGIVREKIDLMELTDNHKIMLAGTGTPDIYTITEVFNKKYAPKSISNNFKDLKPPILSVKTVKNTAKIAFIASKYLVYEIFRVEEDETKLVAEVKNQQDYVVIEDKELKEDVIYSYYAVTKQINHATGKIVKSKKSQPVKAIYSGSKVKRLFTRLSKKQDKQKKRFKLFKKNTS
jgi:membrane peptidoglycan carboxypeptidase